MSKKTNTKKDKKKNVSVPKTKSYLQEKEISNVKKAVILFLIFTVLFVAFYFITVYITNKGSVEYITNKSVAEGTISYQEILAGQTFNMSESEYYVLFYDESDEDLKSEITNYITTYKEKEDAISLYTVDYSNGFNKYVVSEEEKTDATNSKELQIKGTTLIKIKDSQISEYTSNYDEIISKLTN